MFAQTAPVQRENAPEKPGDVEQTPAAAALPVTEAAEDAAAAGATAQTAPTRRIAAMGIAWSFVT